MNKYQTVTLNTFYVMIGTIGSKLIYLLMLPLYTRWLSAEEYGAADTITVYSDILITVVFLNIADAIFVFPKMTESEERKKEFFSSGLFFIGCMAAFSALLFLISGSLLPGMTSESVFLKYKWLIWGLLLSRYLQMFIQNFTRSLDKMMIYSTAGIVLAGLIAVFSFLLVPRWGVQGYIYALMSAQIITAMFSFFSARAGSYLSARAVKRVSLQQMLVYSVPLAPNSMMWWLINGFNRPLMEQRLGLMAIGVYAIASRISGLITNISAVFGPAWSNSILSEYGKEGFERFYNNYLKQMATLYGLGCILLIVFADFMVRLFTTPAYYDAALYIPFIALGLSFSCLSSSLGDIFAAAKKSKYFFYASFWGGIVSVGCLLLLMPVFQLYGVAISLVLSFLTILFVRWVYARKYVHIGNGRFYTLLLTLVMLVYLNTRYVETGLKYVVDALVILIIVYAIRIDVRKWFCVIMKKNQ